jgi:multiple antibiotic resistance protein
MEEIVATPQLLGKWYVLGVFSLFPLVNPFSTIPLLLSLTRGMSAEERKRQATRAALYSAMFMEATLLAGAGILAFFQISVPALRIAGGLVVAFLGFRMLFPAESSEADAANDRQPDHALIPLAFPSLCGAGTMALLISYSSSIESTKADAITKLAAHGIGFLSIVTVALLAAWLLRSSTAVAKHLGDTGMEAITRIMGLLMVCIGVQFIANGVREFAVMPM